MTKTPEGYLVCHTVPICRTGAQEYLPRELGIDSNQPIVTVFRTPDEVFRPSAVASFEGKPLTDDHPPVGIDSSNYSTYVKGVVQNVRRGSGEDNDKLVCDIVIYDAALAAKVEAGKREISCGYDCKYIANDDGTYHQADIIGNHVAIVNNGRAGHDVSIKDSKPKGGKSMSRKKNVLHRMFAAFVKDADPDEVREAAQVVNDVENGGDDEKEEKEDNNLKDVMDAIDALNERVAALASQQGEQPTDDEDDLEDKDDKGTEAMDSLEEELDPEQKNDATEDEGDGEESVTVPPEDIETDEDTPEESCKDVPQEREAQDKAIALSIIRSIKPIVATMPNPQRRRVSDAMSRAVRKALRKGATQPLAGGYGALTHRRKVNDSALNKQGDPRAFGENCRKRNPHYKGGN
nr:MAG TPA: hypothetical protein [Caudoviricetes sp.]